MLEIKMFNEKKENSFIKKLTSKRGDSHFLAIVVIVIVVCLIGAFIIPRIMKTSGETMDKTEQAINDMWNYRA